MNGFHKPTVAAVAAIVLVAIVVFWILSKRKAKESA